MRKIFACKAGVYYRPLIKFMEKAILRTLIYADIFNYPLKAYEIHKWLIQKQVPLQKIRKKLNKFQEYKGYYFLKNKCQVLKRIRNMEVSKRLFFKAKILTQILKIVPWIKLVGISGGLAMGNACKKDDIDLFIITSKNRLWLSRIISNLLLLPVRRERHSKDIRGKFCLNVFITQDNLAQKKKDLYTAHEILQMKVIWEREGMYGRFLEENEWAFKYLPNWTVGQVKSEKRKVKSEKKDSRIFDILEKLAKWVQLKYMGQPDGFEGIEDGALYFHPQDCRQRVLDEYRLTVLKL